MGSAATRSTDYTGGTINTALLEGMTQGFSVIAYSTGTAACYSTGTWVNKKPNFMYNQKVAKNDGSSDLSYWYYTPVKYWPNEFKNQYDDVDASQGAGEETDATNDAGTNGGKVSFFAYAPYVAATGYTTPSTIDTRSAFNTSAISDANSKTKGVVAITSNVYESEPEVKYVLGSNASSYSGNAVDLLWGMRAKGSAYSLADGEYDTQASDGDIYNTDLTKQTVEETIDFKFKHALAKIAGHVAESSTDVGDQQTGLQVILDIDNKTNGEPSTAITGGNKTSETLVTVNSITIQDLATYNDGKDVANQRSGNSLQNVGWFNIANGTWSGVTHDATTYNESTFTTTVNATSDPATVGRLNADIAEQAITNENKLTYTSSTWKFGETAVNGVTTTAKDVYTAASNAPGILLIPSDNDQTFVVTITYTVRTYDAQLAATYTNETNNTKAVQTITNQVTIPGGSLAANKYYKLLIHLGLTSVKFSATVADWVSYDDENNNGQQDSGEADSNEQVIWLPSNTLLSTNTTAAAGSTSSVNVVAGTTGYTINLTGLTAGNIVVATGTNKASSANLDATYTSSGTAVQADGKATVTITNMAENTSTSQAATSVITITEFNDANTNGTQDSGETTVSTTTVNITQGKKVD